jgi:hypothetical protein
VVEVVWVLEATQAEVRELDTPRVRHEQVLALQVCSAVRPPSRFDDSQCGE